MQLRKRQIITITAIVLVAAVCLVFYIMRGFFYFKRGDAQFANGQYDQAISDYNKTIEINPRFAQAYNKRAVAYYNKGEYDKAWVDVHQAQSLRHQINPEFLKALREASGREK